MPRVQRKHSSIYWVGFLPICIILTLVGWVYYAYVWHMAIERLILMQSQVALAGTFKFKLAASAELIFAILQFSIF